MIAGRVVSILAVTGTGVLLSACGLLLGGQPQPPGRHPVAIQRQLDRAVGDVENVLSLNSSEVAADFHNEECSGYDFPGPSVQPLDDDPRKVMYPLYVLSYHFSIPETRKRAEGEKALQSLRSGLAAKNWRIRDLDTGPPPQFNATKGDLSMNARHEAPDLDNAKVTVTSRCFKHPNA